MGDSRGATLLFGDRRILGRPLARSTHLHLSGGIASIEGWTYGSAKTGSIAYKMYIPHSVFPTLERLTNNHSYGRVTYFAGSLIPITWQST